MQGFHFRRFPLHSYPIQATDTRMTELLVFIEDLRKKLSPGLSATLGGIVGGIAVFVILVTALMRAWDAWNDRKSDRRPIEAERRRLELLKLRYDIEALRKQHDLPLLVPEVIMRSAALQAASPADAASPTAEPAHPVTEEGKIRTPDPLPRPPKRAGSGRKQWRWLAVFAGRAPGAASLVMTIFSALFVFLTFLSFLGIITCAEMQSDVPSGQGNWKYILAIIATTFVSLLLVVITSRVNFQKRLLNFQRLAEAAQNAGENG